MRKEFKESKFMRPTAFYLNIDGSFTSMKFSTNVMSTTENKDFLSQTIRDYCKIPGIVAASLAVEINIRNNESNKATDGLMIVFSRPDGDVVRLYNVNSATRETLELREESNSKNISGRFSRFFNDSGS